MKRRATYSLLFLAGFLVLDRGLAAGLLWALETTETGEAAGRGRYSIRRGRAAEVVLFGSSRMRHHLDPSIVGERTGLDTFNAGVNGQGVVYAAALQAAMLDGEGSSQLHVLNLDAADLFDLRAGRAHVLSPLGLRYPSIDEVLGRFDLGYELKVIASRSYRFNSMVFPIAANFGKAAPSDDDGFAPLPVRRVPTVAPPGDLPTGECPQCVAAIEDFVHRGREHGVEIVFVTSPVLFPSTARQRWAHGEFASLSRRLEVLWIDGQELGDWSRDDFSDAYHLNENGSAVLSTLVAAELERLGQDAGSK